jgi:hypothetical protein
MLHPDLQPFYHRLRYVAYVIRVRWVTQFVNFLIRYFSAGRNIDGLDCEEHFSASSDGTSKTRFRVFG